MHRGRLTFVAVVAAAIVVVSVVVLARQPSSRKPAPVSPAQATAAARSACSATDDLQRLVEQNARLDVVRAALHRAEVAADTAARGDAIWQALDGGVKSLRIGIEADDARATRVGIDVVRSECRRLG